MLYSIGISYYILYTYTRIDIYKLIIYIRGISKYYNWFKIVIKTKQKSLDIMLTYLYGFIDLQLYGLRGIKYYIIISKDPLFQINKWYPL